MATLGKKAETIERVAKATAGLSPEAQAEAMRGAVSGPTPRSPAICSGSSSYRDCSS